MIRIFDVQADGFKEPESGVDRAVLRRPFRVRKAVGPHALIDPACKRPQNVTREFEPAASQGQTRERDHRVASPIGKPGITCNNHVPRPVVSDELTGCRFENSVRRILTTRSAFDLTRCTIPRSRGDHKRRLVRREIEFEHARTEQIFVEIEASFAFDWILKIEVPG